VGRSPLRAVRGAVLSIVAVTTVMLVATAAPSVAGKPVKPGKVTALAAEITMSGTTYSLASTWHAATNTTSYQVKLVDAAGTALDSDTVTTTAWTAHTTRPAGTVVRVQVTPVSGTRKGGTVSLAKTLPDKTGPTGTFGVAWTVSTATVTQQALSDNVSPEANITRWIDWNEGAGFEAWLSGTTVQNTYPATDGIYRPLVKLVDQAGNETVQKLHAVVIGDDTAPSGTFTAGPATAWSKLTAVQLTQTSLSDDFSNPADVTRLVDWADGSPITAWTSLTAVPTHVYATGGTYTPLVTITDEAGNTAQMAATAVAVTADTVKPVVRLTLPKRRLKYVGTWKTLKGRATDTAGTGVARVEVKAVQKRGTAWYAFKPTTRTWVKTTTKARAFAKAGVRKVVPTTTGSWAAALPRLRKGTLVYKVVAVDKVANRSATVTHQQRLTRS
jgi:hypothetical protein